MTSPGTAKPLRVAVTGAAGYFGRILVPALLDAGHEVVGLDRSAPPVAHSRYRHVALDLATADETVLGPALDGVDVALHLAFRVTARPGEATRADNVDAQERFLPLAARRVPKLVVASAAAAYGFAPGRDATAGRLDEDAPLHPGPGVAYAEEKQALERLLDRLEAAHDVCIVRARPTNVGGPRTPPDRAPQLAGPLMFAPAVRHPLRQQLLHEDDMASGFLALLTAEAGAYNFAPDDWLTLKEAARAIGQGYVELPPWVLRGVVDMAWRSGQSTFDASWLTFLEHPPIILANDKLRALGWAPRHTSAEALMATASRIRGA